MALRDILAAEGLCHSAAEELALQRRLGAARTYVEALESKLGKTAAGFNVASPFARKLEDLLGVLMGPGSRISVSMGRGEFSSKMGMQIRIIEPDDGFFSDPMDFTGERLMEEIEKVGSRLSDYFGLPVHTENTEDAVVIFTIELRVQS